MHSQAKYADLLSRLSGKLFQDEVALLHIKNGVAFQTIPTAPSGDGGIDGLSHEQSTAYCCYGLELNAAPAKTRAQIRNDICEKFRADLRRILELEFQAPPGGKKNQKKVLAHCPNPELAGIMAPPHKLTRIILVCNVFDDNKMVGALNVAFEEYKKASQRRFVADNCELVIRGPKELASIFSVDDYLLARLENPELVALLEGNKTPQPQQIPETTKLDGKFMALAEAFPAAKQSVQEMRDDFFRLWCDNIGKMEHLNNALPHLHKRVLAIRDRAARKAQLKSMSASAADAHQLIEEIEAQVITELKGMLPEGHVEQFASTIIGALLGDCPLGWS